VPLRPQRQVPSRPQRLPGALVPHPWVDPVPRRGREHQADRFARPPVLEPSRYHFDVEPSQVPAGDRGELAAQLQAGDTEPAPGQRQRGLPRGAPHLQQAVTRRQPGQDDQVIEQRLGIVRPDAVIDLGRLVKRVPQPLALSIGPHRGQYRDDPYYAKVAACAGVVLAGGRSARMGTPKAALEWHGSTLLCRTVGIVARATSGSVVVVRAPGQDLPELPEGTLVADDPREGRGPVQGIAAGLAALTGRADVAFVSSTDLPFLHPAFIRRVLHVLDESQGTDVALPVARGYEQPLAAAYRVSLAGTAERLVQEDRLRPAFLFDECRVETLDDAALKRDPMLAALDPDLDSVLNVNTPEDYVAARARPQPEVTIRLFGGLTRGGNANGPLAVRAATVGGAADALAVVFDRHVTVTLNGDRITGDRATPLAAGDTVFFASG
jgi:molybdenum cofactor guanylyltransferase